MKYAFQVFAFSGLSLAQTALASILPPNDLHLQDRPYALANISEDEFNRIVDDIITAYKPLAKLHGATLVSNNRWNDSTVNASATQSDDKWIINMYGGLARRPEVTPDGFALVVCHELGHHFAGFPFYGNTDWASSEGQSDYFATQSCARRIWKNQKATNDTYRAEVRDFERERCDRAWTTEDDRALCYRTVAAGQSLATLLASMRKGTAPRFETPDSKEVEKTFVGHPEAQCRLDTYLAGAVCGMNFDEAIIPARRFGDGQTSSGAEELAARYSCMLASGDLVGVRPRCWYKPGVDFLGVAFSKAAFAETDGNDNGALEPGETANLTYTLRNASRRTSHDVKATLASDSPGVTVLENEASFGDIAPQEQASNDRPLAVKIDESVTCGSDLALVLKATSAEGNSEIRKEFVVGKVTNRDVGGRNDGVAIPDGDRNGVSQSIENSESLAVRKARVTIDVRHPYARDLRISLVSPSGKSTLLFPRPQGEESPADENGLRGVLEAPLSLENGSGTWTLRVADELNRDAGRLVSWALALENVTCGK